MKHTTRLTALLLTAAALLTACGNSGEDITEWVDPLATEDSTVTETLTPDEIIAGVGETTEENPYAAAAEAGTESAAQAADETEAGAVTTADVAGTAVSSDAQTAAAADPSANDPSAAQVPAEPTSKFGNAIWVGRTEEGEERYFFFYDDRNGTYLEQDTGMGLGFTYELEGESVMFHFGAVDSDSPATISWMDGKSAYLVWDTGMGETLSWLRDDASAPFEFFSNEQLCEMALGYYEAATGYRPSNAAAMVNYDGMIAVQLYDNMGDHNSTSDWYTVDRYTAVGTNMIGETIDLKSAPMG